MASEQEATANGRVVVESPDRSDEELAEIINNALDYALRTDVPRIAAIREAIEVDVDE